MIEMFSAAAAVAAAPNRPFQFSRFFIRTSALLNNKSSIYTFDIVFAIFKWHWPHRSFDAMAMTHALSHTLTLTHLLKQTTDTLRFEHGSATLLYWNGNLYCVRFIARHWPNVNFQIFKLESKWNAAALSIGMCSGAGTRTRCRPKVPIESHKKSVQLQCTLTYHCWVLTVGISVCFRGALWPPRGSILHQSI